MTTWNNRHLRACECCERSATPLKRKPGEPNVVAICIELSGRGEGKHRLIRARRINVCTDCLEKALRPPLLGYGPEAREIFAGFRERVSESYRTLLSEEEQLSADSGEPLCR
jgi:hypothetical protein